MHVYIVTGASRGLGAAFIEALLSPDHRAIGISRTPNVALALAAKAKDAWLDWYLHDLSDVAGTDALATSICDALPRDAQRYVLINNAAVVDPVGPVSTLPAAALAAALNVNIAATCLFSARFIAATDGLDADRRILNISSGSGRRPMDGNGVYSATKAAVDMFTRCMKAEQDVHPVGRPVRVVSLAPGVIETDMQINLRSRDQTQFPQAAYFAKMKDDGMLATPDAAARKILGYLDRDDFGTTEIDDIRSMTHRKRWLDRPGCDTIPLL